SRVVVTGASAGIGRETALHLARKGAHVWAAARSQGPLEELAGLHPRITPVVADVADADSRAALVAAAEPIDVLVNNAGVGWTGLVEDMPADQVRTLFEINVLGLIDLTQRVLPGMLERRRGHVVNVASIAGFVSAPPITVYSATKFAVQGFSDGLRRELNGRGVRVTSITPGPVKTLFSGRAALDDAASLTVDVPDVRMGGVPAWTVARAIARSVRMGGLPGYTTVSVPRVLGLSRLGAVPLLQLLVDGAGLMSRQVGARGPKGEEPPPVR
ncbi:MAG TPA: SDR family NAD(P)-dependent oxidoreductase, partial [Acidimicrobiales bacterium]|nr:SDR family NAD(P)-dependent oxidoreductase [Acidimicrobiales bacterium]